MSTPSSEQPASLQNPLSLLQETMVNLGHSSLAQNLNPDQNKLTNKDWIKPLIWQICKAILET